MATLLCAATDFEIRPSIDFINSQGMSDIDILITGVGMPAAVYQMTKAVLTQRPSLVVQAGLAGCLDHSFSLGDVVLVKNETIGDLGVEEQQGFHSLFDFHLLNTNSFPWNNKRLPNKNELLDQINLQQVNGVTINEISTVPARMDYYKNTLGAQIESMEGAALHYVCLQEKIPFLQIRSLSNFAGERDKSKWVLKESIAHLNLHLQQLLKLLSP